MSDINKRIVHCPFNEAANYLAAFMAQHRTGDGSAHIALRLPIGCFAERRSLVERRLCATLYPLRDTHQVCSVTWSLPGANEVPEFNGALVIEKHARDDRFGLLVCGNYELLPFPDTTCDATLFRRITQASARKLLRTISEFVERACAHSFAARAGYRKATQYAVPSMRDTDSSVLTS
jgi:hypothetical protein